MSPAVVPSGYDPDELLLCDACGQLGPESKVYPHVGTSPGCTEPLTFVSDGDAVGIGYLPGSGEVINIHTRAEELAAEPEPEPEAAPEGEDGGEHGVGDPGSGVGAPDDADEEEEDEDEEEGTVTLTPGPRPRVAASPKDGTLRRHQPGRETRGMRINNPAPGAVETKHPEAITASVNVKVSLYTLSLFDVARNEATLGFGGTLEEFLDQCPQALFKMMGFDGMFLLRQNHAIAQLEAAVERVVTPRAVAERETG